MPQAYLISPLIAVSPADISLQPYQELELIISINIPYLVGGTGVMNIVTYTSSGSSLKFEKFVSVGGLKYNDLDIALVYNVTT